MILGKATAVDLYIASTTISTLNEQITTYGTATPIRAFFVDPLPTNIVADEAKRLNASCYCMTETELHTGDKLMCNGKTYIVEGVAFNRYYTAYLKRFY